MRLHDNVALQLASHHTQVIPLFLWSKGEQRDVRGCLEVILKDALFHINEKLTRYNMKMVLRMGDDSASMLKQFCEEYDVGCVYWNKGHTPETRDKEEKYRSTLSSLEIACIESQSSLLYDPIDIALSNGFNGGHWGTLMPFLRSCRKQGQPRKPIPRHETFTMLENMKGPNTWPSSKSLDELDLAVINGKERWDLPIVERFPMSEEDALANMNSFFEKGFAKYETSRSRADIEFSTSKLSAHLRVGTLSPNELYYKVEGSELEYDQRKTFTRRLAWRDLAYFHLRCFPKMMDTSIRSHYEETEWVAGHEEARRFNAWKNGKTGFPLVDAAMKELYKTGWMTQSLRMIVASFLVEYLRVNWVKGCDYFHYTLADADTAINSMMWQNAGRSGIDQWNFVMSPIAGSQDPTGKYTRTWLPELSNLPTSVLHKPWEASEEVLKNAGVTLGNSYPHRIIVDLKSERQKSIESVLEMRRKNQSRNTDRGYDLIKLPNGEDTVVFTKKEFRIDNDGNVITTNNSSRGKNTEPRGGGRGRKGQKKNASPSESGLVN